MLKSEAIELLGGTVTSAAREIGITVQAVCLWPDVLSDAVRDRVQAALWRRSRRRTSGGALVSRASDGAKIQTSHMPDAR